MNYISKIKYGDFGTVYDQFYHDGKNAIKHLIQVQEGECIESLYRPDIGDIDIVWGENNEKNKGFGLKHIIEKHGHEIEQLGFKVEDFIPIIVQYGIQKKNNDTNRIILESKMFRVIISKIAYRNGKKFGKTFILSAFDLRPIATKNR